jgi:hypothetical protein
MRAIRSVAGPVSASSTCALQAATAFASWACNNAVQVELGPCAAARPDRRVKLEKNTPALLSDNVKFPLERPLRAPG